MLGSVLNERETFWREIQYSKHFSPISETEFGMKMDVKDEQL
jgi:hypothetical protein